MQQITSSWFGCGTHPQEKALEQPFKKELKLANTAAWSFNELERKSGPPETSQSCCSSVEWDCSERHSETDELMYGGNKLQQTSARELLWKYIWFMNGESWTERGMQLSPGVISHNLSGFPSYAVNWLLLPLQIQHLAPVSRVPKDDSIEMIRVGIPIVFVFVPWAEAPGKPKSKYPELPHI